MRKPTFLQGKPSMAPHAESAGRRAIRTLGPTITSVRFVVWLLLCEAGIAGYAAYRSADSSPRVQGFLTGAAIIAAFLFAVGTALMTLWVSAPVRQRDDARSELAALQEAAVFPDVEIKAGPPLIVATEESKTFRGQRETLIAVQITATNRETQRRAFLAFAAHVTLPPPLNSVRRLTRTLGDSAQPGFLLDPLKLDPLDHNKGEVFFLWTHEMDFVFGKDATEETVVEFVAKNLNLSAKDHISNASVIVELPETAYRV